MDYGKTFNVADIQVDIGPTGIRYPTLGAITFELNQGPFKLREYISVEDATSIIDALRLAIGDVALELEKARQDAATVQVVEQ